MRKSCYRRWLFRTGSAGKRRPLGCVYPPLNPIQQTGAGMLPSESGPVQSVNTVQTVTTRKVEGQIGKLIPKAIKCH